MLEYIDFEVKIERRQGREYAISVIKSPAGEASGTFILPFTPRRLKGIRETIEIALMRSMMPVRRVAPPEFEKVKQFGRELYTALFKDDIKACYDRSSSVAFREGKGLRLKLRLDPTLINLPWEFMYSREMRDYLALCRTIPPVRYTELPQPVIPLEVTPPLRILVVIASPSGYASLNVEREKERITSALIELQERGIIKVEFLEGKNTLAALQRQLRRADYHVLHFIGHGGYDEEAEEGLLLMEDARGRGRPVSGQWLGRLLRGYFPMRLVVLNACEGALTSSSDPFAGVAAAVVSAGVPAVVAMQFEITDEAAIIFSREFYSALADNYPVDAAVTEARIAIVHSRRNTIEWATPVLYMRAPHGMIFALREVSERVIVKPEEERLAALYAQAGDLLTAENWSEAIARCDEILATDPTHRDALNLLAKAKEALAQQEKEEKLLALHAQGVKALVLGHWEKAISSLEQIVAMEPYFEDAAFRLAEARSQMAKEEAERERQEQLAALYKRAMATMDARQWQNAISVFEQVQALDSSYHDTATLLAEAKKGLAHQEKEEKLTRLYNEAMESSRRSNWQEAIDKLQQVLDLEEDYKDAAVKLAAAQEELSKAEAERARREKLTALYEQAVAARNAKQWQKALDLLEQVRGIDPSYRATESLIAEAQAEAAKIAKAVAPPRARPIASPAKRLFPGQLDDERVIIYERRYWFTIIKWIWRPLLFLLISSLIAWVVTTLLEPTSILSLVFYGFVILALAWLVWNALDWENDRYILTDKRVIHIEKKYLTREKRDEAPLVMIQDVYVEMKGLMTHLLYFGDVTIQTAGTLGTIRFRSIQKPRKAQAQILALVSRAKGALPVEEEPQAIQVVREIVGWPKPEPKPVPPLAEELRWESKKPRQARMSVAATGGVALLVVLIGIVLIAKPWRWLSTPTATTVAKATATSPVSTAAHEWSAAWPPTTTTKAAATLPVATPPALVERTIHVVQPGENLSGIALRYGVTVEDLMAANAITSTTYIHVGQQLEIPVGAAPPTDTPLTPTPIPTPPTDEYEIDDFQPKDIILDQPQLHSFYPIYDIDRVKFVAEASHYYRVFTSDLVPAVDTYLDANVDGDHYTNDDCTTGSGDLSSCVEFQVGTDYDVEASVKISNRGQFGPEMWYQITVEEFVPTVTPILTTIAGPDEYEIDDFQPKDIILDQPQLHSFYPVYDVDRVKFLAKASHYYRVYTSYLAPAVDTYLDVSVDGNNYTNDDCTPGSGDLGSCMEFQAGTGYDVEASVRISNRGQYGPEMWYQITVEEIAPTPTPPRD